MFTSLVLVLEYFQINGDLLTKLLIPIHFFNFNVFVHCFFVIFKNRNKVLNNNNQYLYAWANTMNAYSIYGSDSSAVAHKVHCVRVLYGDVPSLPDGCILTSRAGEPRAYIRTLYTQTHCIIFNSYVMYYSSLKVHLY